MNLERIAIVPARGGSKRIKGKNIRLFAGKPIIQRVLETLDSSGLFKQIIVSTEDDQIAELVEDLGFEVPFRRPPSLASDYATTAEVVNHAIHWLERSGASRETIYLTAYPTAVFMTTNHLSKSVELLQPGRFDIVFAASRFRSELQRAWWVGENGSVTEVFPGNQQERSQDLKPAFFDAGQFYWSTATGWTPSVQCDYSRRTMFELGPYEAVDINTEDDWEFAEMLFQIRKLRESEFGRIGHERD